MSGRLALLAWAGCGPSAATPPGGLQVEGAVLELASGAQLTAAQATVQPDGTGAGVTVTARGTGSPPLDIQAPRSTWDLAARKTTFEGGVTATRGDMTLTCARLSVTFASRDRVDQAVAEGDVRVVQGERRASGDRAELDADTGRVVLTGAPRIAEGPNQMTGERITLYLEDARVECDRCRLLVDGDALAPRP